MLPKKTIVKTTPETYDRLRSTLSSTNGVSPRRSGRAGGADDVQSGGQRPRHDQPDRPAQRAPSTSGNTTRKLTTAVSAMPTQSRLGAAVGGLRHGSTRRPTTIANRPTGTLIRNSERQSVPNGSSSISAADDRPQHRRETDRGTERRERLADVGRTEDVADQPEGLRDHHRRREYLEDRPAISDLRRPGDRAEHRRRDEPDEPGHQHPLAPERVAQPAAGQQADRDGQGVGRRDPLQRGRRQREVALDRRGRDVEDRRVQDVEDHRAEDHRESDPLAAGGR